MIALIVWLLFGLCSYYLYWKCIEDKPDDILTKLFIFVLIIAMGPLFLLGLLPSKKEVIIVEEEICRCCCGTGEATYLVEDKLGARIEVQPCKNCTEEV